MGCGSSTEAQKDNAYASTSSNGHDQHPGTNSTHSSGSLNKAKEDPQELIKNAGIDRELDRARQQQDLKVKLLLLGAGESGKSTVFKQMRILHGAPRTEDDQKMYGVVVRSNVVTAMRKLCTLLRTMGLEDQLALETADNVQDGGSGGTDTNAVTPKEAYDIVMAHLIDGTASPDDLPSGKSENDWVGSSARAGMVANNDANDFIKLWRYIKTLWEVGP